MASQLIYTSAPRLLEAGRTGFGTVARHRAVSGLLVAAVERVSQFAHLSGLSPRRVVLSHRLIQAGATSYHLLSCIRDAGSDYTGRTNHLAHHLIMDAREAQLAAEAGITPADVLRQMRWRSSWSESPRFFEPAEEISLSSFRPSITAVSRAIHAPTWQRLTGNAEYALLPAQATRCLLLLPGEDSTLDLFHESLLTMEGRAAWQVSFSTHLEPTDDLAELRWIALNRTSSQRQQVEGAACVIFDLTAPQSLPAPKPQVIKASPVASSVASVNVPTARAQPAHAIASSPLPSLFEEPTTPKPRSPWPLVAGALLIAAAGVGAFVLLPKLPSVRSSPAQSAISIAKTVDDLWQRHQLILPTTKNWLKAQASEALLDSHAEALNQLAAALREPLRPLDIPRPESTQDEFMDMILHFSNWQRRIQQTLRDSAWSGDDPHEIQSRLLIAESQLRGDWSKFALALSAKPQMPNLLPEEINRQVLKRLSQSTAPRQGTPAQWLELLDRTKTEKSANLGWIHYWEIAAKEPAKLSADNREKLKEVAKFADSPVWFRELIQKQLAAALTTTAPLPANEPGPTAPAAKKTEEVIIAADGPASLHPRYIIVESQILPLAKAFEAMPILPIEADMQIFIGQAGAPESQLVLWKQLGASGVYRRSFNDSNTLEFRQHRLIKLPSEATATRLIARSASGAQVLFEIVVLPKPAPLVDVWPASADFTFQSRQEGARSVLDAAASRWLQTMVVPGGAPLRLQHVDDVTHRFRLRNEGHQVIAEADTAAAISQEANKTKLNALDVEMENLRQGLRIDEKSLSDLAGGNLAQQQKEAAIQRLNDSMSARQQRLSILEKDRLTITPEISKIASLPSGVYSLFAGLRRLCEIKIQGSN